LDIATNSKLLPPDAEDEHAKQIDAFAMSAIVEF
jgi:hypothetical protein